MPAAEIGEPKLCNVNLWSLSFAHRIKNQPSTDLTSTMDVSELPAKEHSEGNSTDHPPNSHAFID
jgi:hypothetical protein